MKITVLSSALMIGMASLGFAPMNDATARSILVPGDVRFVTSCADDGRPGTLRSVIARASNGQTIEMGALACASITLQRGAISIPLDDLMLQGPFWHTLMVSGGGQGRVFDHTGHGTLSVSSLTVAQGVDEEGAAAGGCIHSMGNVSLDWSTVRNCVATGTDPGQVPTGGGIFAAGELTLNASTVSGNLVQSIAPGQVYAYGGGAYAYGLVANYSTISGNAARVPSVADGSRGRGGGAKIVNRAAVFASCIDTNVSDGAGGGLNVSGDGVLSSGSIVDSTISGNVSNVNYGGVFVDTDVTVLNSTIAFNHPAVGGYIGGLYAYGNATLQSSIIANNAEGDFAIGYYGVVTGANNLIMSSTASLPPDTIMADPLLAPLRDNGGLTRTHALSRSSLAIDAGNNAAHLVNDQRGFGHPRRVGAGVDIGAFETGH